MQNSILNTIKKMLNLSPDDTSFDEDIIVGINSALMNLQQVGVGPDEVFNITGPNETWSELLTDVNLYSGAKTYVYLSVKKTFDPPGTSFLLESMDKTIEQTLWRLTVQVPIPVEEPIPTEL